MGDASKKRVNVIRDCVFDGSVFVAGEVELPQDVAEGLLNAHLAEPVKGDKKVERAVAPPQA